MDACQTWSDPAACISYTNQFHPAMCLTDVHHVLLCADWGACAGLEQFDPRESSGAAGSEASSSDAYDSDPTTDINSDFAPGLPNAFPAAVAPPELQWPFQPAGAASQYMGRLRHCAIQWSHHNCN